MCFECVLWVYTCPLSLTNLAECNYNCLRGHREPAPPPAIETEKRGEKAKEFGTVGCCTC